MTPQSLLCIALVEYQNSYTRSATSTKQLSSVEYGILILVYLCGL